MIRKLIEKLRDKLSEEQKDTYNDFKWYVSWETLELWDDLTYFDVEDFAMKLDSMDDNLSFSVWWNKAIEYVLNLLTKTKQVNLVEFDKAVEIFDEHLWSEEEFRACLEYLDYSDVIEQFQNVLTDMKVSFWVAELWYEWAIAYYMLWDQRIEIDDCVSLQHDSYKELYDDLYRLESLCLDLN